MGVGRVGSVFFSDKIPRVLISRDNHMTRTRLHGNSGAENFYFIFFFLLIMATAKYAPADWHTSNSVIRSSAENQRSTSHDIRNRSNITRNETGILIV